MKTVNTAPLEIRNGRIASMTLLIAALVLFVAFHFLPGFGPNEKGWHVWPYLSHTLLNPRFLIQQPTNCIANASFLNFSLLIVVSPFLTRILRKSRLVWWLATSFSGLAAVGFFVVISSETHDLHRLGWGILCLLIAPFLNFSGLILARGNWAKKQTLSDCMDPGRDRSL